ncbi:acyltransferase family protein [Enterobacter soli]|uniref:acyltransferase family protein n=1 Tax=Enterobacter soli TaxID=885040 RepID=UPI003ED91841
MQLADISALFIFISFYISCYALSKLRVLPHIINETSRIGYIDGLRGIAAVLVVCAHSWRVSYSDSFERHSFYDSLNFDHRLGAVGVQIFFCITGYLFISKLINNKNQDWHRFFVARLKRLAPAYFFAITLLIMITYYNAERFGVIEIVKSIRMYAFGLLGTELSVPGFNGTELFSVLWSLPYEWKFYFMMPVVAACMYYRWTTNLAIALAMLCVSVTVYLEGGSFSALFLTGAIAAYLDKKVSIKSDFVRTLIFITAVTTLIYTTSLDINNYGIVRIISSSFLFIAVILCKPTILCNSALRFMGEISYSLYLLHIICYYIFANLFDLYFSTDNMPLYILFYSFFTCALCTMTFKYIEYPFIKKPIVRVSNIELA